MVPKIYIFLNKQSESLSRNRHLTPYILANIYLRFGETCCFPLQILMFVVTTARKPEISRGILSLFQCNALKAGPYRSNHKIPGFKVWCPSTVRTCDEEEHQIVPVLPKQVRAKCPWTQLSQAGGHVCKHTPQKTCPAARLTHRVVAPSLIFWERLTLLH
jgi:hypothetical protein